MEVKIGVKGSPRELVVETELSADDIAAAVRECAADPQGLFQLDDTKGRRILIPSDKLAYVEIGEQESRRVGFGPM